MDMQDVIMVPCATQERCTIYYGEATLKGDLTIAKTKSRKKWKNIETIKLAFCMSRYTFWYHFVGLIQMGNF